MSIPLILMYHRIAAPGLDPWGLSVSPTHFDEQLEILKKHATPVSLRQAVTSLRDNSTSGRTFAVTFDDGYADNLTVAAALLEQHDVPATVFVCSAAVGDARAFWWDELARILLTPDRLPDTLYFLGTTEWDPSARLEFLGAVHHALQPLRDVAREEPLATLARWAGVAARGAAAACDRALTGQELATLAAHPLVDIGCHTSTHPVLTSLSIDEQRSEIAGSKSDLEASIGQPVVAFAYPYGVHDETTRAIVKDCGFAAAWALEKDADRSAVDLFRLPRVKVDDLNGEEFERVLTSLLYDGKPE